MNNLFFNLASVARIASTPIDSIDRFEVWESLIAVVFKKGWGLRPKFLSKKAFYSSFVEDRKARSRLIEVTLNPFANRVYTARNTTSNHSYTVIVSDAIECQCADYRSQVEFIGRGVCKHGYAVLDHLGFNSLSDWQAIERLKRSPAPADWPQFAPRPRPTIVNGRSID